MMTRPWRSILGVILSLCVAGCRSVSNFQVMPPRVFDQLDVSSAAIASAPDGAIFLVTQTKLLRIQPQKRAYETLFEGTTANQLDDVAVSDDGLVFVTDHNRLRLFAGAQLHNLLEGSNPSQGWYLSAGRDTDLYLCSRAHRDNQPTLFHYNTQNKQVSSLAEFDQPIEAIAAVRGGCLVATEDTIYKVFRDEDSSEVISLMVCSIHAKDRQMVSLAVDETQRAVYFATQDGTWAYLDGQVVLLLPAGGQLAFAGDRLTIWDTMTRQLLQIKAPATRARKSLGAM